MSTVLIEDKVTKEDIVKAKEDYPEYIKVVADIKNNKMVIGGAWHADGEKILLEMGFKQEDIWGGGINLLTKDIDTNAVINIRSGINDSPEILNPGIKEIFISIVKNKFEL